VLSFVIIVQQLNCPRTLLCMVKVSTFTFNFIFLELGNQGEVELTHWGTKDQLVDIMTRAFEVGGIYEA